ncbi:hypothetical protein FJTKL_05043 [Diaporthe vaccinii]|uniref:Aminotransferase class I/classII large domain-containing protein n=1 Tax=Diaporthe vaccinii TaxID=105482 RepID=A0ABR4EZG7_9PEZI
MLSDEVYDSLIYVDEPRLSTLSPEVERITLTVGSAGKMFYCTGWRDGWLIGPPHLIQFIAAAHTRICYSSVSPLQEAVAIALKQAFTQKETYGIQIHYTLSALTPNLPTLNTSTLNLHT